MEDGDLDLEFQLSSGGGKPVSMSKGSGSSMDYALTTSVGGDIPQKELEGWKPFFTFNSKKQEDSPMFCGGGGVKRKFEDDDTFVPEKGFYQPSSEDTWEAYQALTSLIEFHSKTNLPRTVLCGVADEVLGVLKSRNFSNPTEKKIEIEKIMNPIHDFLFNELVNIASLITDYYVVQPVKRSDDRVALFVPEEGFYQPKTEDTCTAYKLLLDTVRENLDSDQPQVVQCVVAHEILVILKEVELSDYIKKNKMESFLNYVSDDTFSLLVFIADLIKDFDEFKGTSSAGYNTCDADVNRASSSGWNNTIPADAKDSSSNSGWNIFDDDAKDISSSSSGWGTYGKGGLGADVAKKDYIQKPNWPRKIIEGFQFDAERIEELGTPPVMTYSSDEDDQMIPKDLTEFNPTVDDVYPDNVSVISDRVADISLADPVPDNSSIISDRVADMSLDDCGENPACGDIVANPSNDNVDALSSIRLEYSSEEEIMYFDHDKVQEDADKEDSDGWLKVDIDEDGI